MPHYYICLADLIFFTTFLSVDVRLSYSGELLSSNPLFIFNAIVIIFFGLKNLFKMHICIC